MGIGGGSGGGGFKLEKTWRATGVGTTTFNSPGNFTLPFGKYEVLVSGRAGTGNPNTPGTISGYNPIVPSTVSGSNPPTPSNISGYNTISPGNPTGVFNAGSGGNLAGYTQSGGNLAGYNATTSGGFNVTEYIARYDTYLEGVSSNTPTGTYNPPSGGTGAGYNPVVPGTSNYNPPTPGQTATIWSISNVCEPYFGGTYVEQGVYNTLFTEYNLVTFWNANEQCPAPSSNSVTYNPTPGNISGSNPPSGGTQNFNPFVSGNQNWNAFNPGTPTTYLLEFYFNNGFTTICPAPYTVFTPGGGGYYVSSYEIVNFSCTPVPGSPGNINYNAVTNEPVFNPFVSGNQNFNSATGGNPNYNAAVSGNLNYNAAGGQNANYNSPLGGVAGASTTVLGVFFPGGNVGAVAPFVPPTLINRYIADDTTYPVNVPTGAYVTIESR